MADLEPDSELPAAFALWTAWPDWVIDGGDRIPETENIADNCQDEVTYYEEFVPRLKLRKAGSLPFARLLAVGAGILGLGLRWFSRAQTPPAQPSVADLEFAAASVRIDETTGPNPHVDNDERISLPRVTVALLLSKAYSVRMFQIVGPSWIHEQLYNVAATLPPGASKADIPKMLQRLVAQRFHLSLRRELREATVYAITVGKGGPKLQPCEPSGKRLSPEALLAVGPQKPAPGVCPSRRAIARHGAFLVVETDSIDDLATYLPQSEFDLPVVDRTNLHGRYAIYLKGASLATCRTAGLLFSRRSYGHFAGRCISNASLKLERRREKIEYLVVDGGDRIPTEN